MNIKSIMLSAAVLVTTNNASAALVVPTVLSPGDVYHVVFVSSTTRNATSSSIADYDAHVQSAADSAGIGNTMGINWRAIVTTPTVDAIDHLIPLFSSTTDVPIYNQNSELISASFTGLWDGSIDNPILYTELNTVLSYSGTWTGTDFDGTAAFYSPAFGDSWLSSDCPGQGDAALSGLSWIRSGCSQGGAIDPLPIYALSEELVVPSVPIPAAFWLFGSGLFGLIGIARRKKS